MSELTNSEIESQMNLREYGIWERQTGISLGYKPPPSTIKIGGRTPQISDSDALVVSAALAEIKATHPRDYAILKKSYIKGLGDDEIGEDLSLSAKRVLALRGGALKAWFYCWRGLCRRAA